MSNKKQRAVVICPGRGTYNKEELGYLQRLHSDKTEIISLIDDYRQRQGQLKVSELDAMDKYSMRIHTAGENASALIYACALADYQAINQAQFDIVAVTGNSMGWYIALAVAGALAPEHAITLINTMGSMMTDGLVGGQMIYPIINDDWQIDAAKEQQVLQWLAQANQQSGCEVHVSINLGGYLVFGGNKAGLKALEALLPVVQDRYPMNLFNHAAFHTPLLKDVSERALGLMSADMFKAPDLPLVDGLGQIWQPYSCDVAKLHRYTLDTQVVAPYNFSSAIEVAIKEFAPDKLIILGPGATLGGATAQCLIAQQWLGLESKADFIARQKQDAFILAMGLAEQRKQVLR
ncbi:Malonyl CoA-acyl carrier protein transacylase [Colwellia chukchiensis]|uniref:[acyl-carrier-protein] S-malonyltransferase n=1 Tax=Colwellia chukchiensis TaxID=641665 RepID=A0A1H7NEV3_9GAMM|nr:ACP S-malonyltransferase [Colwellia chukchiensis]SEL21819.1 Malonyl CoA-acyl carrier protein transacylase [Colwellia chukchiensis]